MNKKYFWLKLHNNFFNQLEIKKLRLLEKGDLYTIIYLKLQLLSITTNGQLFAKILEDSLVEELALEINETAENVQGTLFFLEKYHLLEILDESSCLLPKVSEVIGSEAASTERVRKMRVNNLAQALQCNTNVTRCNTEIELEIEIKKEINVELYSDKVLPVNLVTELEQTLPVKLETALDNIFPVKIIKELAVNLVSDLSIASVDDYATITPIKNIFREEVSLTAEQVALVSADKPIIAILPTSLPTQALRIACADLQEEQDTKRKMQIITDRLLARLQQEKPTVLAPLSIFVPAICVEDSFEDFWKGHPHAYDRTSTFKVWQQTLAQGISAADLVCAAKKYALKVKSNQTLLCYVSSSRNFLLNNKFWEFLPTYSVACPQCHGKGSFAKSNISGEQDYYSCNCHQRYQSLSRTNLAVKASA